MSRTYRRRRGNPQGRNYIVFKTEDDLRWESLMDPERERARQLSRYHSDAAWVMSVPGWFNHQTCTKPLRAMFRGYETKLKRMVDLADALPFPERLRRPWFW